MKKIARTISYILFRLAIRYKLYSLIAWFYSKVIKERSVDGTLRRFRHKSQDKRINIFALTPHKFRGDLDCFTLSGRYCVLQMDMYWQTRLMYQFYPQGMRMIQYLHPSSDDPSFGYKVEYQKFLSEFLPRLYKKMHIECVISPHLIYIEDTDWGIISNKIGVPYIVLHKENLYAAPIAKKLVIDRYKQLGHFQGSYIIVHNEIAKETFIQSGYVKRKQIRNLGCLRMDGYLKRLKENRKNANKRRKKVVFFPFYFHPRMTLYSLSFFAEVHIAFVRFAMSHPETDVIIKPKPKWSKWRKDLQSSLEESNIELQKIPNLIIRADLDAQEIILDADVVSGVNSTTVVEAAIAGKPVIIPYFKELQYPANDDYIFFKEEFDLFDIAESGEELIDLIIKRLEDCSIDKIIMEGRKAMFEKYVSSLSGNTTDKYVALIKKAISTQPQSDL